MGQLYMDELRYILPNSGRGLHLCWLGAQVPIQATTLERKNDENGLNKPHSKYLWWGFLISSKDLFTAKRNITASSSYFATINEPWWFWATISNTLWWQKWCFMLAHGSHESTFPAPCSTPIASSLLSVKSLPSLKTRNSIVSTRKKVKFPHRCVMQDPKSTPTTQCQAGPYASSNFCLMQNKQEFINSESLNFSRNLIDTIILEFTWY